MIAVAGEALIDLVARDGRLLPHAGGGPFNTAIALGRLGVPVCFLGGLSGDWFGKLLERRLQASGVDLRYVVRSDAPTPLAVVHTDENGDAEYSFYLADTAYADFLPGGLPELGPEVHALCVGTLALATDPPAKTFELLMARETRRCLVVVDPNVRPAVIGDPETYRRRFREWIRLAHVVKLSADDAAWLYPGVASEDVLELILDHGARLAIVTLGAGGAIARNAVTTARAASPAVRVVDTIGAGDAFTAGFLRRLWDTRCLDSATLVDVDLEDGLAFAVAVGALQCTRAGAVPPLLAEVETFVQRAYAR